MVLFCFARAIVTFVAISLSSDCRGYASEELAEPDCRRILDDHAEGIVNITPDGRVNVLRSAVQSMDLQTVTKCAEMATEVLSGARRAIASAYLAEQVALHPVCLADLETKSAAQTRCSQKWYKIGIHALRVEGLNDEADSMFQRAISLRPPGSSKPYISWPSPLQTPTVWIEGLRSKPTWDCSLWPFVKTLEEASLQILAEIRAVAEQFSIAYPYLTRGGTWQDMFLHRGHEWNTTLCTALPLACRVLLPELPTKPGVPYTTAFNEEVVIFRSEPGASVGAHCGSSNTVINLHLTLTGASGTSLLVGGEEIPLRDRKAVCFQDSFFHGIEHSDRSDSERISLVVRVMHPDLTTATYGDMQATDIVDLTRWDPKEALAREVERLRNEHRKLALAVAATGKSEDL